MLNERRQALIIASREEEKILLFALLAIFYLFIYSTSVDAAVRFVCVRVAAVQCALFILPYNNSTHVST